MILISLESGKSSSEYSESASASLIYEMAELIIDYFRCLLLVTGISSPTISAILDAV
jgi:hypothetical protein